MTTESYQNQKITKAGDYNPKNDEMNMWKCIIINQRDIIVFSSILLFIAVVGKTAGYSVVHTDGLAIGAGALEDHQVDATNSALAKGIFGMGDVYENEEAACGDDWPCPCNVDLDCVHTCLRRLEEFNCPSF